MLGSLSGATRDTGSHKFVRWAAGLASAMLVVAAAPAHADDEAPAASPVIATTPMQDPVGSNGFRTGENGRLHPYLLLDLHWVTNPGFLPQNVQQVSDLLLATRIGLDGAWKHTAWDLGYLAEFGYNKYFGVQQTTSSGLSGLFGHARLDTVINKDSDFVLKIDGDLRRAADVGNQTFTERLWHWITMAHIQADIRPGGGALVVTPIFGYFWDKYDQANFLRAYPNDFLNNQRLLPELRVAWAFLPKTSLFVSGAGQITFFDQTPFPSTTDKFNINSDIMTVSAGLSGSLTPKVTTLLQGGYTNTFTLSGGDNLQTGTGAIIFNYAGETVKFSGGLTRQVQPASLFRYVTVSRAYLQYDQQVASRTVISIAPEASLIQYGTEIPTDSQPNANDRIDFNAGGVVTISQALGEWWTLTLTDHFDYRESNFVTSIGDAGYLFNDVFVSLRLRY